MVCDYAMLGGEKFNVVCLGYELKISRYIILLCVLLLKRLARLSPGRLFVKNLRIWRALKT